MDSFSFLLCFIIITFLYYHFLLFHYCTWKNHQLNIRCCSLILFASMTILERVVAYIVVWLRTCPVLGGPLPRQWPCIEAVFTMSPWTTTLTQYRCLFTFFLLLLFLYFFSISFVRFCDVNIFWFHFVLFEVLFLCTWLNAH